MKKNSTEMAWNEPGKDQSSGEGNKPKREGSPPDLEEIFGKMGKVFSGGNKRVPQGFGIIVSALIGILFVVWMLSGIYMVDAGQRGIELFLGKHSKTKEPGLTWRYPYPLGAHKIVDVERIYSKKIKDLRTNDGALMLTKDEAIASVSLEVQYRIDDEHPEKYWFASLSPDKSVQDVVESATRERVGQTILDNVLTKDRQKLTEEVKSLAQIVLDKYGTGILIVNINLEDAQPPEPVQNAFERAITAREDQQKRINTAEKVAQVIIAEVKGEAEREITEAEGYRDSKIAIAQGEAGRFVKLVDAYSLAPEVTRERLYLETMESILARTSKIVMNSQSGNNLMVLPIEQLLKNVTNVSETTKSKANAVEDRTSNTKARLAEMITEPTQIKRPQSNGKENNSLPSSRVGY